mmetsp:Transcript_30429/g.77067  ORF Transcript_30429/g.77067 Transcript_30429/m.77067 type:complete len:225 (-) Transcript_30429:225-899(-)
MHTRTHTLSRPAPRGALCDGGAQIDAPEEAHKVVEEEAEVLGHQGKREEFCRHPEDPHVLHHRGPLGPDLALEGAHRAPLEGSDEAEGDDEEGGGEGELVDGHLLDPHSEPAAGDLEVAEKDVPEVHPRRDEAPQGGEARAPREVQAPVGARPTALKRLGHQVPGAAGGARGGALERESDEAAPREGRRVGAPDGGGADGGQLLPEPQNPLGAHHGHCAACRQG